MDREKIIEALDALLNAPDQLAAKKIVEARQEELLSENADQVIASLLEQNRDNPEAAQVLEFCQDQLARCRREGIEAFFAGLSREPQLDDLQALLRELKKLAQPRDLPRRVEVCQAALALVLESPGRSVGLLARILSPQHSIQVRVASDIPFGNAYSLSTGR